MPIFRNNHPSIVARQMKQMQDRINKPYRGAIFAKILSTSADSESVTTDSFIGRQTTSFAYPFASENAWIRGMPEPGTTMLAVIGGDSNDLTPLSYYDGLRSSLVTRYLSAVAKLNTTPSSDPEALTPYRNLQPGDIDLGSQYAQVYMGLRDVYQARGGLTHFTMTSLKTEMETPTLHIHGAHHQTIAALNDEVRFGAVRRSTTGSSPTNPGLVRIAGFPAPFAKEWSVVLNWTGSPAKLIDFRSGIVVEDDGRQATSVRTQKNLRHRQRWHTGVDFTALEIDESGNWSLSASNDATDGGNISIPVGSWNVNVGQSMTLKSSGPMQLTTSDSLSQSASLGYTLSTPARADLSGDFGVTVRSKGGVSIETQIPGGISLGFPDGPDKVPLLVANNDYITTLNALLGSNAARDGSATAYGTAAAAAWAAIGALTVIIDPTGTVFELCAAAGAAGLAMSGAATAAVTASGEHQVTISPNPVGFISVSSVAE